MDNELSVLSYLEKNQDTTQRKIARGTDLSPGAVNFILKKMVKKGLVKLEKVNGRTLRYILTPQGMTEKTRRTYRYMRNSYRQIIKINNALEEVAAEHRLQAAQGKVVFYGPQDEILELLKIAAKNLNLDFEVISDKDAIEERKEEDLLVVTWVPEDKQQIGSRYRVVNLMERV